MSSMGEMRLGLAAVSRSADKHSIAGSGASTVTICALWKSARIGRAACASPLGHRRWPNAFCLCAGSIRVGARTSWLCSSPARSAASPPPWWDASWSIGSGAGCFTSRPSRPGCARARRKLRKRPWAIRKPKYWRIAQPGDLVEIDTKEIRMRRGVLLKHFSARDVVSRWDVVEMHHRATSLAAARFLETLLERLPFPVRALQVDGGSEFAAEFEEACQQKQLPLFVLPPKSPKLNAHVERSHRTHNEEFYEVQADSDQLPALNQQLRRWEKTYNCVRPHQSLAYLTPLEFLTRWKANPRKAKCH